MAPTSASRRDPLATDRLTGTLAVDAFMAVGAGVSLLIVGHAGAALPSLESLLPRPIFRSRGSEPLALPDPGWAGTLLIHEIDDLAADDQLRLLHWFDMSGREGQIVSTARASLLPLVQAGKFLEALYYRLNVVCIDITSGASDRHVPRPSGTQRVDPVAFE